VNAAEATYVATTKATTAKATAAKATAATRKRRVDTEAAALDCER
jgi:hypothetical protein